MEVDLMTPDGFVMGLEDLGIVDLTNTEMHCVLLILVKPELENTILATDLMMVMANFGIMEEGMTAEDMPQYSARQTSGMGGPTIQEEASNIQSMSNTEVHQTSGDQNTSQ